MLGTEKDDNEWFLHLLLNHPFIQKGRATVCPCSLLHVFRLTDILGLATSFPLLPHGIVGNKLKQRKLENNPEDVIMCMVHRVLAKTRDKLFIIN